MRCRRALFANMQTRYQRQDTAYWANRYGNLRVPNKYCLYTLLAALLGIDRAKGGWYVVVSELAAHPRVRLRLLSVLECLQQLCHRRHRAARHQVNVACALALRCELQDGEVAALRELLVLNEETVRLEEETSARCGLCRVVYVP